jgi:hypothetical protein
MDFKLRTNARYFSDEELLDDLRKVARILGKETVEQREYPKLGKFSAKPFLNRFGSWNLALDKAGLKVVTLRNTSNQELFDNLEAIWLQLGRQPFYGEIKRPFSKYGVSVYCRRFGGWFKACEAFIKSKHGDPEFSKLLKEKSAFRSRTISEKLRLQVYKRDRYGCMICGRCPKSHPGVILHIDHVIPFSRGGDNSLENLRTLCDKCNLGRGNNADL